MKQTSIKLQNQKKPRPESQDKTASANATRTLQKCSNDATGGFFNKCCDQLQLNKQNRIYLFSPADIACFGNN